MRTRTSFGRIILALTFGAFSAAAAPASLQVQESAGEVTIATSQYKLSVTRKGFGLRLSRGDEVVLESAQPDDPTPNASFELKGSLQKVTDLKALTKTAESVTFEYATTNTEISALFEIRPAEDSIRITSWLPSGSMDLAPGFRYRLAPSGLWYGGGFQGDRQPQTFPLNDARIDHRWFLANGSTQGTPAWYSTKGVGLWIRTLQDFRYAINGKGSAADGLLSVEMPGASALVYDILIRKNIADLVRRIVREIGYPKAVPPDDYFRLPIYTTWVEHQVPVSQAKVLEYAHAIHDNKLPCGVIEIDDKWEALYGDMQFDKSKFPDPKAMTDELHRLGYRVTLWVHPFINLDSATYADARNHELFVHDINGRPGLMRWWNGIATVWDMTNPRAGAEFRARLTRLQKLYGLDGFKFDGADANLLNQDLRTSRPITPAAYPDIYNAETAAHFAWEETRVGLYSQPLGIVQRLIDKQSIWGKENGLAAIVPEAITVSMRGFQYVMPDMIGGNQYDGDKIGKELLIRWAQASALMPLMQFSWGPWHFDDETVALSRAASDLHLKFAPYIIALAKAATRDGEPILRPIWYNEPADQNASAITDQFMLGKDVVVAPVVEKGAASRALYLPAGRWKDYKSGKILDGGKWIKDYPAPLDTLPVFVRDGVDLGLK